jgi:hypothetical protein
MSATMTIELVPTWKVLKKIRGERIPAGRTIESLRDKMRRRERQEFRHNRHRQEW